MSEERMKGPLCRMRRSLAGLAAALFLLPLAWAGAQEPARFAAAERIVVFGDVHGAYTELTELLRRTGIVDAELAWSGGTAQLVSLGDLLDRGPDSRRVLDLLMRLQHEANAAGGQVHVVLGNHELMNVIGDLRYVSAAEYAAFADEESAETRDAAYAAYAATQPGVERAAFDQMYPPGYFGHRAAFAPDGTYGRWLMSLPAVLVIGDTAFVHGGLSALVAGESLTALNTAIDQKLRRYLELRAELAKQGVLSFDMQSDWQLARAALDTASAEVKPTLEEFVGLIDAPELGLEGPMWYRGSVYCKPMLEEPTLDAALAALGAARVAVGHTPTEDHRIHAVYSGKLIMVDTGMLHAYYDGRPSALVLEGGTAHIEYAEPSERVALVPGAMLDGYGMTETELLEVLESGTVTSFEPGVDGMPGQVDLRHGDTRIRALFYPSRDGELELAAAGLDDLLGTTLVPPTAQREIDGTEGALQLIYPGAVSEADRLERNLALSGWCPIQDQLQLLYTFDLLTYNRGRTPANVYYRNELSDLVITAHGRAFGDERVLPSGFDLGRLQLPTPLRASLQALDADKLEAALGEWLGSRQIRGLVSRRDRLID